MVETTKKNAGGGVSYEKPGGECEGSDARAELRHRACGGGIGRR